jgi:hypothetical protein
MTLYFQLKDAAQLALKKMPSSEQEALSMVRESVLCLVFSPHFFIPGVGFIYPLYR